MTVSMRKTEAARLTSELATAKTLPDSLKLLYDIFDLSMEKSKEEVGYKILELGKRSGNEDVISEIIPQLAAMKIRDVDALDDLEKEAGALTPGDRQKAARLFVNVEKAVYDARFLSPDQRHKVLLEYFREDMTPKNDIYEDIADLYRVVVFIRHTSQGYLYLEYLTRLEKMILSLPECNRFLRKLFYTTAANYYTDNGFPEKAIESDRQLLEIIEEMEKQYKESGRQYRNYDLYYFNCYRRMLSNYEALEMDEVKELFSKCAILAEKDSEVAETYYSDGRINAYRHLAEHDFKGAIPYLKKAVDATDNRMTRSLLLQRLIEAADSVGDEGTLVVALKEQNSLLTEGRKQKSEEVALELRMRYDVNKLRSEKSDLEMEKKDLEIGTKEKVISITLVALLVLALILMFLYRSHFRLLSKTREVDDENRRLRKTIEDILDDGTPEGTSDLHDAAGKDEK